MTPNGAVFSFADLAASLLDSVVYISTAQRVAMTGRSPTPPEAEDTPPDAPAPPGEDFFDDFFDEERQRSRATRAPCSRSARASSSMPQA